MTTWTQSSGEGSATWNTLWGGLWSVMSLVAWEDLDKHDWEDWS